MEMMSSLRGELHRSWGWLLTLGSVLILFGGLILTTPLGVVTASLTVDIWISAALLVAGAIQLLHGWSTTAWRGRLWQMLGGLVFIIAGILMFVHPTLGLLSLTMIVAVALVVQGIVSLFVGASLEGWGGRRWLIISAIASIIAGSLLLFDLPTSAGWTLGTTVGVALVLQGVSLTLLSLDVRRAGATPS
ncbi:MAG: hypothetical protein GY877_05710 [Hyphomicrobium sp.]|nr:hypothetical protein [Hyphomicrobium sp.]